MSSLDMIEAQVEWNPGWRIIPSRFPPIGLFDRVADPQDLEAVYVIEGLTNDRLRDEVGKLSLVPPEERISGPGTTPIMAAFTHLNPQGSRFTDGTYGVFYVANLLQGAIAEARYHRERFMRHTNEPPQELDMRVYHVVLRGALYDVRHLKEHRPELYDPNSYQASQQFARTLRERHASGILYHSVRYEGALNAAVFRPKLLSHCMQERHLCFIWNGHNITTTYRKELVV